ncbi:alpha/beta hydrolase [Tessaracoccus sp. G1721]
MAPYVIGSRFRRRFVRPAPPANPVRGYRWPVVWTRIVPGAALVLAVLAGVLKSGDAVVAGHWAYLAWLIVAVVAGAGLIVWAAVGRKPRPGTARTIRRWLYAALGVGLAAATLWLAPYRVQVADPASIEAPPGVVVTSDAGAIRLAPTAGADDTGVAFIPGALVDPRAYIPLLAPLAEAGHPVYIANPPLGIAFLAPGVAAGASQAFPDVTQWVMSGHSLGGVVASSQADSGGEAGLILLASYPLGDLSTSELPVLSISGSNDMLTTPDDVEASRATLPGDATFVVIDGGVHAFFGDYGPQAGDGTPEVSREAAQGTTVAAMLSFLDGL